ncbi:MAG: hypothetical protein CM15mV90_220 [uncultured marine virus]|nr:MAG: hypothetical protein CM15mV90_220 [uncultured marine virus]
MQARAKAVTNINTEQGSWKNIWFYKRWRNKRIGKVLDNLFTNGAIAAKNGYLGYLKGSIAPNANQVIVTRTQGNWLQRSWRNTDAGLWFYCYLR